MFVAITKYGLVQYIYLYNNESNVIRTFRYYNSDRTFSKKLSKHFIRWLFKHRSSITSARKRFKDLDDFRRCIDYSYFYEYEKLIQIYET